MASIDVLSLYDKFGNFFEINIEKMGKVFEMPEIDETVDRDTTIRWSGKYLSFSEYKGSKETQASPEILKGFLAKQLYLKLKAEGYKSRKKISYCVYRDADEVKQDYGDIFRVFRGFSYRVLVLDKSYFLCIDPHITLETMSSIAHLIQRGLIASDLEFPVRYKTEESFRIDGYLLDTAIGTEFDQNLEPTYFCKIKRYRVKKDEPSEDIVSAETVFPESRPELIQRLLEKLGIYYNIIKLQRNLSFIDSRTASKDRFAETIRIVNGIQSEIFPLAFGDFLAKLNPKPIIIKM
jgi:hypothetical protein